MERTQYIMLHLNYLKILFFSYGIFFSFNAFAQFKKWEHVGAIQPNKHKIPIYNVLETSPPLINDGKTDNSNRLQTLINDFKNYPSPAIFYFPKGKYLFNKPVYLKSGRIIRGQSPEKTKFISYTNSNLFIIYKSQGNLDKTEYQAKLDKTKNYLLVSGDSSYFKKGNYIEIYRRNDSTIIKKEWKKDWARDLLGMMNRVHEIRKDTITLAFPIEINYLTDRIYVKQVQMIEQVGFENFSIVSKNPKMNGHNFLFINAVNSWIDNIESAYAGRYHVSLRNSLKISIKNSYFHHAYNYGGGGHAYGVECAFHTTNSLIENNIFDSLRHAMLVHLGANGNVFAYNYSVHPIWNEKGIPPDISVHGHYPYNNLFEGNEVEKIACTDYWGAAGPKNTFYRNKINGEGIFIKDADQSLIIGNECINPKAKIHVNNSSKLIIKHNIIGTKIINPTLSPLPKSLYLEEKPSFLKKETWPSYGYINNKNQIPAKKRYYRLKHNKRKNIFAKMWHWIKNIF